jgi:redox-sensitive bicupin YhaK (pirin superfamily)
MNTDFYAADTRGKTKLSWLDGHHTFSFGDYHNPSRVHFGAMRVINDDIVQPSSGFEPHSHQNMEIITIPLDGMLAHKDHLGNHSTIQKGEVQIMSAGTGIIHSEHNPSNTDTTNLFQIWIFPKEKQIMPRYGQKKFEESDRKNKFQCVVSPDERNGSLWINQDAYISLANLEKGKTLDYELQNAQHGAFVMVIEGSVKIENQSLNRRDGVAISDAKKIPIQAFSDAEFVVFEVPMIIPGVPNE